MTCQTPTACGRLNAFQKVMLQWSSLHPYNAVHAYKIAGPLRLGDLAEAVETTFRRHGLGIAHLSADGQSFRHETDFQPEVEAVASGDDFINSVWPWLSATARRQFMWKWLPMSGGISNVVVRDAWMHANRHVILDYQRGVPTGPNVPIVLSPTTFRDHLNVGVSYRTAGFSRAKIDGLMEMFRDQIEHPNKASRGELRRPPVARPAAEPVAPRLHETVGPANQ